MLAMDVEDVLNALEYAVCSLLDGQVGLGNVAGTENEKSREARQSQIITGIPAFSNTVGVQWHSDAKFISLKRLGVSGDVGGRKKAKTGYGEFSTLIAECTSFADAATVIFTSLTKKLAEMFMKPETDFDSSQPLSKYGVDSLVAIELRNWLVAVTKADVSLFDVLQSRSLADLAELTAGRSTTVSQAGLEAA
jgi:hypothetical protein